MILLIILSFIFSFLFALGGVGSAIVLVPIMFWFGFPLSEAKPTGLFINTISLLGATISNIKGRRLDFKAGLPLIIFSLIFAPIGAYFTKFIPRRIVLIIFVFFLFFSSLVIGFFRKEKKKCLKEEKIFLKLSLLGAVAGFLSGLLGVGGGGLIMPVMIFMGFDPKKVATLTALVVPFSSLAGFVTYLFMGFVNLKLLVGVSIAAFLGGYLGTHFMHAKLSSKTVKRILSVILLIIAIKLLLKIL